MARSRSQIAKNVCRKFNERDLDAHEGPVPAGPYVIYRIWTEWGEGDSWDCQAHYAVEHGDELLIFEDFSDFGAWLSKVIELDKFAARRERFFKTIIAAIIVLGAFAIFAFAAVQNPERASLGYIATAIIGGGAGFLFGNWARR